MATLEARGVELSWSERGQGSPVLLVHESATGSDAWEPVAAELERGGVRAIAYDRRGWGSSTAPQGYRRTTIEEQSEDAACLIGAAGDAPAVACGAGIGAVVALDLLLRRPELIAGAVLVEPPLLALLPEATELLSRDREALATVIPEQGVDGAVSLFLSGGLVALGAGAGRLPESLTAETRERPGILFAELGAPIEWQMPLPRLAEARCPSLLVTATSTPDLLQAAARTLAPRLAGCEARELEVPQGAPHLERPEAVAALVLELAGR